MKRFFSIETIFNNGLVQKHRIQYLLVFCAIILSSFIFVKCNNSDETDTDYNPVAYGTIDSTGNILGGSDNFTVTRTGTGHYSIAVTGHTLNYADIHVDVSIMSIISGFVVWATGSGNLLVYTFDRDGVLTNQNFSFSVWNN
jgi:hypothetical protein